ncbi:MAG TPA: protease complex subunit PrcB family protein [Pyrinomonadaceae bacterium]|nr:protease complex subunit PrcB family protein [Pyrinomonadaceae bacterium]
MRTCVMVALLSLAVNGGGAAGCGSKGNQTAQNINGPENRNTTASPTPGREVDAVSVGGTVLKGEIKVLAEGSYSQVNDAFVGVARDAETYAAIRELAKGLPDLSADFFQHNAVIAAFLGQRRTGGYGVSVTRAADGKVQLEQVSPAKGSMTTQALSAPFKIVSVPTGDSEFRFENTLTLELGGAWQAALRPYRVTAGEFRMFGGFAAHSESFGLTGDLRVMREGSLATFVFNLKSSGGKKERSLQEVATGVVQKNNQVTISYVEAGTLVDRPRSALHAQGSFTGKEESLSLEFGSLPSNISDGFGGEGKLEAAATAPAPQKNKPSDEM